MCAAGKAGKQNTENTRPVYTRELPFGRTLTGATPGAYRADGTFVPWDCLGAEVNGTELSDISETSDLSGSVLVIPEGIVSLARSVLCCSRAAGVVLPDSCRTAGDGAFFGAGAVYIRFPVSFSSAGRLAFSHSSLRSAVVPFSAETGPGAFRGCLRLVSACVPVPSGKDPFLFCGELVTVHTPRGCFAAGRM